MRTYLLATAAVAALMLGAVAAEAAPTQVDFKIDNVAATAHSSGSGLLIQTQSMAPRSFSLGVGDSKDVNLLRIWTTEGSLTLGEDTKERAFSMSLHFALPAPGFSTSIGGTTSGHIVLGGKFGLQSAGEGYLDWAQNFVKVDFTSEGGKGTIGIRLEDVSFNRGDFAWFGSDLNPGKKSGAVVTADIKLIDFTPVPEPASMALLGAGLLGLGFVRRRKAA